MTTHQSTSTDQAADAADYCNGCGGKVAATDVGWTHVDSRGGYQGWLCPEPHVGIAKPRPAPSPLDM